MFARFGEDMRITTRKEFIRGACVALFAPPCALWISRTSASDGPQPVARGREFLSGLFDPGLGLLPEYCGAKIYWLFHDNYLAAKVLARSQPEIARRIGAKMRELGVTESGKIEMLFGEAKNPLPFRQYSLDVVAAIGEKLIKTERAVGDPLKGWEGYADLLLLASIAEAKSAPERARERFGAAMKMWDGMGLKDRAVETNGIYATYKLALGMIAAARLDAKSAIPEEVPKRLLAMQGSEGGWITDYLPNGTQNGLANVETTCLAILGVEAFKG